MEQLKEINREELNLPHENQRMRILVADDDENIREILKDALSQAGHHIVLCSNGEEAWRFFHQQEFDLVITDLGMPKISGWELNRRIKQIDPQMPVVIISGWGAQLSEEEVKASRVDLVLAKPFNLDQMLKLPARFNSKGLRRKSC